MSVLFPNVPAQPGVPPLQRVLGTVNNVSLLIADAMLLFAQKPKWGIYKKDGTTIALSPDSYVEWGVKHDWAVADFPIENGGYMSYDRVDTPSEVRIKVRKGGSTQVRQRFLKQLQEVYGPSTALYKIQVPETMFSNTWAVTHYDYERKAEAGVTVIEVDLWFKAVRLLPGPPNQNPKQPNGAGPLSNGSIQSMFAAGADAGVLPGAVPALGGAMSDLTSMLGSVVGFIGNAGNAALSAVGGVIGTISSSIGLASVPLIGGVFSSSSLVSSGLLVGSVMPSLVTAVGLSSLVAPAIGAPLALTLGLAIGAAPALAQGLINTGNLVGAGGTDAGFSFNLPTIIPGDSLLGQQLNANPGAFTSGNMKFGPVYPAQVQ